MDEFMYVMIMLGELYVDMHDYVMRYMVWSSFHICGYGFHLRWSYNLCYTGVDVDTNLVGEA